ncbi:MAG: DEAD/DEAH box helicase [Anaerolineales bacterium]|nr:DEAD/DEAH box helicase [Anaerolineales bacterium]
MSILPLLHRWRDDPEMAPYLVAWERLPPRPADLRPFPADLPFPLGEALRALGIDSLYSHQLDAWGLARRGVHVVLTTGTASGKSLAYHLPILADLLENPQARALYLFPTKALAQDQMSGLERLRRVLERYAPGIVFPVAIYDGDTPSSERLVIRKRARLVLTNPDMLHAGILPHHTDWADFFSNLKFVVVDEMHAYRGVFGSHVANVLRRLKRVAAFYRAKPQFLLTSASIANPRQLAEMLIEAPVVWIEQDGSGRGERHYLIYNPPMTDRVLGLRKNVLTESAVLSRRLLAEDVQHLLFVRSRRSVEFLLRALTLSLPDGESPRPGAVRGYRSGYLPSQRREIERGLRDGTIRAVVATNALELGMDIGGLEAVILVGFPGSIASFRQQAGRAGRGSDPALALLVASSDPIDQYLARHPDYLFGRSPEQALINPDHLLILLQHLRCALFELPFQRGETFGKTEVDAFLDFLVENGETHRSQDRYYWMANAHPAAGVSLRSASAKTYALTLLTDRPQTIGTVDGESVFWMAHPGAVYLHEAQSYRVERLDLEQQKVFLAPFEGDYFTEPIQQTEIRLQLVSEQEAILDRSSEITHARGCGELLVTARVIGFRKVRWFSRESLGEENLDLPPSTLQTTGYWLSVAPATVERLTREGLWTNAPNHYGPEWPQIREMVRRRDHYRCQVCGRPEQGRQHDVHHKIPFRMFRGADGKIQREKANALDNLTTLCPECHRLAEQNVRVRSGLAGLVYVLRHLAPFFLMCDATDLGSFLEPVGSAVFPQPTLVLYDRVPAGIGFSRKLYEMHFDLLQQALDVVEHCACQDGCPSCVGPGGEQGLGSRQETLALLKLLIK